MNNEKSISNFYFCKNQDELEKEFKKIYDKYYSLLVFIASNYIANNADIEDIVQETFISLFNNIINVKTSIKSYLTTSCKNHAIDFLRKNKNLDFIDIEELSVNILNDYSIIKNETLNDLLKDMKRVLPKQDLLIIFLHLLDDFTFEEIASKLNLNVKTVKTKYYRSLKQYQKMKGV